ncbi:MAG: hypothetical protein WDW36_002738 [Sanguina aurantia]
MLGTNLSSGPYSLLVSSSAGWSWLSAPTLVLTVAAAPTVQLLNVSGVMPTSAEQFALAVAISALPVAGLAAQVQLQLSDTNCAQVAGPSLLTWSSIDTALTRTVHVHVNCAPAGGLLTVQLLADSNVAVAVNSSAATLQLPAPQFALGATQAVYRSVSGDGLNASLTIRRLNGSAFPSSLAYTLAVQSSTGCGAEECLGALTQTTGNISIPAHSSNISFPVPLNWTAVPAQAEIRVSVVLASRGNANVSSVSGSSSSSSSSSSSNTTQPSLFIFGAPRGHCPPGTMVPVNAVAANSSEPPATALTFPPQSPLQQMQLAVAPVKPGGNASVMELDPPFHPSGTSYGLLLPSPAASSSVLLVRSSRQHDIITVAGSCRADPTDPTTLTPVPSTSSLLHTFRLDMANITQPCNLTFTVWTPLAPPPPPPSPPPPAPPHPSPRPVSVFTPCTSSSCAASVRMSGVTGSHPTYPSQPPHQPQSQSQAQPQSSPSYPPSARSSPNRRKRLLLGGAPAPPLIQPVPDSPSPGEDTSSGGGGGSGSSAPEQPPRQSSPAAPSSGSSSPVQPPAQPQPVTPSNGNAGSSGSSSSSPVQPPSNPSGGGGGSSSSPVQPPLQPMPAAPDTGNSGCNTSTSTSSNIKSSSSSSSSDDGSGRSGPLQPPSEPSSPAPPDAPGGQVGSRYLVLCGVPVPLWETALAAARAASSSGGASGSGSSGGGVGGSGSSSSSSRFGSTAFAVTDLYSTAHRILTDAIHGNASAAEMLQLLQLQPPQPPPWAPPRVPTPLSVTAPLANVVSDSGAGTPASPPEALPTARVMYNAFYTPLCSVDTLIPVPRGLLCQPGMSLLGQVTTQTGSLDGSGGSVGSGSSGSGSSSSSGSGSGSVIDLEQSAMCCGDGTRLVEQSSTPTSHVATTPGVAAAVSTLSYTGMAPNLPIHSSHPTPTHPPPSHAPPPITDPQHSNNPPAPPPPPRPHQHDTQPHLPPESLHAPGAPQRSLRQQSNVAGGSSSSSSSSGSAPGSCDPTIPSLLLVTVRAPDNISSAVYSLLVSTSPGRNASPAAPSDVVPTSLQRNSTAVTAAPQATSVVVSRADAAALAAAVFGSRDPAWPASPAESCSLCPAGSYSAHMDASSCQLCPQGQHNSVPAAVVCSACDAGYYTFKLGSIACRPCIMGTYSATPSSWSCQLCPSGTTSLDASRLCNLTQPTTTQSSALPDISAGTGADTLVLTFSVTLSITRVQLQRLDAASTGIDAGYVTIVELLIRADTAAALGVAPQLVRTTMLLQISEDTFQVNVTAAVPLDPGAGSDGTGELSGDSVVQQLVAGLDDNAFKRTTDTTGAQLQISNIQQRVVRPDPRPGSLNVHAVLWPVLLGGIAMTAVGWYVTGRLRLRLRRSARGRRPQHSPGGSLHAALRSVTGGDSG